MAKESIQVKCVYGGESIGDILRRSFQFFLERELAQYGIIAGRAAETL